MALMKFKTKLMDDLKNSIESKDYEGFLDTIAEAADKSAEEILMKSLQDVADSEDREILRARGKRMLTSEETKFYNSLISAMKSPDFKNAITGVETVFPESIFDETFEDLTTNHDVIKHLDVRVVSAKVKVYFAKGDGDNKAVWGKTTGKIVKEIAGSFEELDAGKLKLSCFMPVPNAMLDLGPEYLDRFVRTLLYEALANGIEDGVINNLVAETGPIGMIADMDKGATISGTGDEKKTTYTAKKPVKVTDWTPAGLADIMSALAKTRNGHPRRVDGFFMIVNPVDYFALVAPALMTKNALGEFVTVSPYPVTVVQSSYVPAKQAIIGLDDRYALGLSTSDAGQLDYSDEYQFLEEVRTYKIKLYGDGSPKDNNSFILADISGLKPAAVPVEIVGGASGSTTAAPAPKAGK